MTANKAIFLDRDDTLIEDPGYINHPSQVRLLPGAAGALIQLKKMGYLLVVASNQSGVARGIVTEETLEQIHHQLKKLLADEGAALDAVYYCPFHPDGVIPRYRMDSDQRKPNPGMLLKAAEDLNIDLSKSWMIGDSYRDVAAGAKAGCRTILIDSPAKRPLRGAADPPADRKVASLREAANLIRMIEQQESQRVSKESQDRSIAVSYHPQVPSTEPTEPAVPQKAVAAQLKEPAPAEPTTAEGSYEKEQVFSRTENLSVESASEPHPILQEILHLVRSHSRQDLYEDFSFFRLVAMVTETLSLFCLIVSIWFWFDSARPASSAQMMLGYCIALQLVTIALLLIHKDR
ncbi:MAG TPA: HAD family hydrolase [Anaerohalosphaeraceae bacterium]|nr:HAD family hydrolase [Anaerohalosphaeraceae bacterium]